MPIRTRPSSRRAHSWSAVYRSSSGTLLIGPTLLDRSGAFSTKHLADATGVLVGQGPGLAVAGALGPEVGDGLLGIGQHQHPALVVEDLDPVDEDQLAVLGPLDERAHDRALLLPR